MDILAVLRRLRGHWRAIFLVHLIFTLVGVVVLLPLFGVAVQATLALSGSVALVDQDIAKTLLSVPGMFAGIVLAALFLAIAGLEMGALAIVSRSAMHGGHIAATTACLYALRHAWQLLQLTAWLTLRVLAYLLPFVLVAGLVGWVLLTEHDINYYLSARPPAFYGAAACGLVLLVLLVFFLGRRLLGWCLVLPLILFANVPSRGAFTASETKTAGHRRLCLMALLHWLLVALMLSVLPAIVLKVGMGIVLGTGISNLTTLAALVAVVGAFWSLLLFMVAALNLAFFTTVVIALYEHFYPNAKGAATELEPQRALEEADVSRSSITAMTALVIAACAALVVVGLLLRGIQTEDNVAVIAHRGAAGLAPENTLASIRQAVDDSTDWVEIDVQETRDGRVLVVHDSDFMKLAGVSTKVWEGDLAQLQQIDVGSWFDTKFAAERPPTLAAVLSELKGRSKLVIELKYYGHDQQLEQRVIDLVEQAGMAEDVMVMSLKLEGVQKVQALRPDWTTGLLAATAVGDLTRIDVDFLAVNQGIATRGFLRRAHAAGKKVYVWTVNDGLSLSHWMSMGVDGVITDEPALARDILEQRAQLGSAERLLLSAALFFGKPELLKQYRDNSP